MCISTIPGQASLQEESTEIFYSFFFCLHLVIFAAAIVVFLLWGSGKIDFIGLRELLL